MKRGFTIIEIIIVVVLMGLTAALATPVLSGSLVSRDLEAFSGQAASALREAQSSVMSGRNNARYGVHFETTKFVLFEGASYSASSPDNLVTLLPGSVTVTAISLTPAGSDVHFASHKGTPTETGAVIFTSSAGDSRTVILNAAGLIEVQ